MIDSYPVPKIIYDEMYKDQTKAMKFLNHIEALADAHAPDDELADALDTFFDHAIAHCAKEEELMQSNGFPGYEQHKAAHIQMLNELKLAIIEWHETKNAKRLCERFCADTSECLYRHIGQMDIALARFIATARGH